ncbi:Hypothetical protein, putative, partial [Bodo saltans]
NLQSRYLALTGRPEPAVRAAMKAAALKAAASAAAASIIGVTVLSDAEQQQQESSGNETTQNQESFLSGLDDDTNAPTCTSATAYRRTDSILGRRYSSRDRTRSVSSMSSILSSPDLDKHASHKYPAASTTVRDDFSEYDLLLSMASLGSAGTDFQRTQIGSTGSSYSVMPASPIDRPGPESYLCRPGQTTSRSPKAPTRSPQAPKRSPQPPGRSPQGSNRSPCQNSMTSVSQPRSFNRPITRDSALSPTSPGSPRPPVAPPPTAPSSARRAPPVVGKTVPTTRNA